MVNAASHLLDRALLPELRRRRHEPLAVVLHRSLRAQGQMLSEAQLPPLLSALQLLSGGQRACLLRARRGNARLGLRQGALSGAKVTLRGAALESFLLRVPAPRRRSLLSSLLRGRCRRLPLATLLPPTLQSHYHGHGGGATRPRLVAVCPQGAVR